MEDLTNQSTGTGVKTDPVPSHKSDLKGVNNWWEVLLLIDLRDAREKAGRSTVGDLSLAWVEQNLPILQIESVVKLAVSVFEDEKVAKDWLNEPNFATDEKPPIALLGTDEGFFRVQTLLHRIEYGVLA